MAGGEAGELTSAGDDKASVRSIAVRMEDINGLLGTNISEEQAIGILNNLGLQVETHGDSLRVQVPSRRRDLELWQDIAEEVGRLYGYDKIPASLPQGALTLGCAMTSKV